MYQHSLKLYFATFLTIAICNFAPAQFEMDIMGPSPVQATLISAVETFEPGQEIILGLQLNHDEHWHSYWEFPGETGYPTSIEWSLPDGFKVAPIEWPFPHRFVVGGILGFGYEDQSVLIIRLQTPKDFQQTKKSPSLEKPVG